MLVMALSLVCAAFAALAVTSRPSRVVPIPCRPASPALTYSAQLAAKLLASPADPTALRSGRSPAWLGGRQPSDTSSAVMFARALASHLFLASSVL